MSSNNIYSDFVAGAITPTNTSSDNPNIMSTDESKVLSTSQATSLRSTSTSGVRTSSGDVHPVTTHDPMDENDDSLPGPSMEVPNPPLRSLSPIIRDPPPLSSNEETSTPTLMTTTATISNIPTSPTTPIRTGKRPSPWREPRTTGRPPPPARETGTTTSKKAIGHQDDVMLQPKALTEEQRRKKMIKSQKKKESRLNYLLSGSIFVDIPLSVTADLGIALRRGREHRIKALHRHFPSLKQSQLESQENDRERNDHSSVAGTVTRENDVNDNSPGNKTKDVAKKVLRHVPQPHEYANVIDYLEAKYVQGVVIADDVDGDGAMDANENGDDDEGQGSVYSETSFLDDTGLQRTIAEQVLGHTTTTKVELMSQDDSGFFVNVGDLEVEETDLTQEMYDPIDDTKKDALKPTKKTRKRKASINGIDTTVEGKSIGSSTNGKKKIQKPADIETVAKKSAMATKPTNSTPNKKPKVEEKKQEPAAPTSPKLKKPLVESAEMMAQKNPVTMKLHKIATRKKEEIMEHFNKLKVIIDALTDDELPRKPKPKRTRVVVTVPTGNKPGDSITFANPHIPGQKLKVKVPANVQVGETFKVTVPKPIEEDNDDDKLGEDGLLRDHNKFNREFYDVLDDYAKAFDEWCDAEGAYRRAIDDKTFTSHFMKRNKCDDLLSLFPKDTKTSISIEYLKKVIRRARQNKHKRELTLAKQQISFIEEHQELIEQNSDDYGERNGDDDADSSDDDNKGEKRTSNALPTVLPIKSTTTTTSQITAVTKKTTKPTRTANIPEFSRSFPKLPFRMKDFAEVSYSE